MQLRGIILAGIIFFVIIVISVTNVAAFVFILLLL